MKIQLTQKELDMLIDHFRRDISYGTGGTFGDGENFNKRGELERAEKLLAKLKSNLPTTGGGFPQGLCVNCERKLVNGKCRGILCELSKALI